MFGLSDKDYLVRVHIVMGAGGGAIGWGTGLRVQFPLASLKFVTALILPAALWPWVRLNL